MTAARDLAVRTTLRVGLVVAAVAGVVTATGVLPDGAAAFVWLGLGVALLAAGIGNVLFARAILDRTPHASRWLMIAVTADFALLLVLGAGGTALLFLVRTKFLAGASFGLAFAASAIAMRIASAGVMSRAVASTPTNPRGAERTE